MQLNPVLIKMKNTLFRFIESDSKYEAYIYAFDGTKLISLFFEKSVLCRETAMNLAVKVFLTHY